MSLGWPRGFRMAPRRRGTFSVSQCPSNHSGCPSAVSWPRLSRSCHDVPLCEISCPSDGPLAYGCPSGGPGGFEWPPGAEGHFPSPNGPLSYGCPSGGPGGSERPPGAEGHFPSPNDPRITRDVPLQSLGLDCQETGLLVCISHLLYPHIHNLFKVQV